MVLFLRAWGSLTGRGTMRFLIIFMLMNSAFATTPYLIEKLDIEKTYSFNHVIESMNRVSSNPTHLISLGESHLHPQTARKVSELFVDFYLSEEHDFKFCAEKIDDFLNHPGGKRLIQSARQVDIYSGNSPNQTDFEKCTNNDFKKYFTYSGFFHQLPFARPFPLEFTPTRVITEDGQNIRDQLRIEDSFFLIQIEMEYIELVTQSHFLKEVPTTLNTFKEKIYDLLTQISAIKESQVPILKGTSEYNQKVGAFFSRDSLSTLSDDSFFLVTDLNYRKNLRPLPLLTNLLSLSDRALNKLIEKLTKSSVYVTAAIQEPDANGNLYQTGYGTIPWLFPANSTFMELRVVPGENIVLTADPFANKLTCIAYKKLNVSKVDCDEYLSDLP